MKYYVEFLINGEEHAWEVESDSEIHAQEHVDYEHPFDILTFVQVSRIGDCA